MNISSNFILLYTIIMIEENKNQLIEVVKLFLKLGVIGFGGPAIHIALMEEKVERKKVWLTEVSYNF
jgi:chromate transport protein ChrA